MEIAERRLKIEERSSALLLGPNDSFLPLIEERFDSSIIVRGDTIIIKGPADEVKQVEMVFKELLYTAGKSGSVQKDDVLSTLDMVQGNTPLPSSIPPSQRVGDPYIVTTFTNEAIKGKTPTQRSYVDKVRTNDIVFAIGPAGTGKTYLAVAMAVAALKARQVQRLVLARPAVEAGESLGFLPGDLQEKVDPYLRPLLDALIEMLGAEKLKSLTEKRVVEIIPLAYMRGRTFNNAFIILDEAQNTTPTQMKMFLTRLGKGSKAVITGDITQIDLPPNQSSGLVDVQPILSGIEGIDFVYFDRGDVVRHRLVAEIIDAYERHTPSQQHSSQPRTRGLGAAPTKKTTKQQDGNTPDA